MPLIDRSSNRNLLLVIIAITVAGGIAFFARKSGGQLKKLREQKKQLRQKKKELAKTNQKLTVRRKRLHQDPYLIKKLAQEKLGLVRPGEKRVWFLNPDPTKNSSNKSDTPYPLRRYNLPDTPVMPKDVVDMPDTLLLLQD